MPRFLSAAVISARAPHVSFSQVRQMNAAALMVSSMARRASPDSIAGPVGAAESARPHLPCLMDSGDDLPFEEFLFLIGVKPARWEFSDAPAVCG